MNNRAPRIYWLAILPAMLFLSSAQSNDDRSANTTGEQRALTPINIVDQYGRSVPNGMGAVGGRVFDVTVGPLNNILRFDPERLTIIEGDTVRWTWASSDHSVTSGTDCSADGEFCSPDNMNCDSGILSDVGFVYELTFTQAGSYSYFCASHCFAGMTGVINVLPRRPRPTPHPRPTPPRNANQ